MPRKKKSEPFGYHPQEALVISQTAANALAMGCDFENRVIYLFGNIEAANAYRFVALFKWLDRRRGSIHIVLNSPGGDVGSGMAMYDTLRTAENPIIIEGLGEIASAAVPILLAGTVRYLNPETMVMIHDLSYEIEGSVSTTVVTAMSRDAEVLNKRYHEIIAERTGKSIKDVEEWCRKETNFTATEAVKLGFADKILDVRAFPKSYEEGLLQVRGEAVAALVEANPQEKKKKKG